MPHQKRWRIGLISDIHGNYVALQTALAALDNLEVDQLVCLGDVATFGPQPCETVAALRALALPTVMGNTDAWLLDPHPFTYRDEQTPVVYAIEHWSAQQLGDGDRGYIRTFVPTLKLELGTTRVLLYHGSPRANTENIRATTPDAEMDDFFADHVATIAIGGHTHTQMVRRYRDMLVVNPGSVGAPVALARGATLAHYPAWTEFAVLEIEQGAQEPKLNVQLHRAPIDVDALIATARASDMPHVDWYIAHWQRG